MAKMLDALARAQRERSESARSSASDESPGPAPSSTVVDDAAVARASSRAVASLDDDDAPVVGGPDVHPTISDMVAGAHDNFSPIAEQARQIRANLESVLAAHPSRSIVVTSPISGDGKTLVSANLAWVLTDNPDQNVLLVDADMRKPNQNRFFGVRQSPGLSELLRGQCSLEDAIHPTSMRNLMMMPAGRRPSRPSSLLSTRRLPEILETLKGRFTWIVFDTPPLLPVSDAAQIARHCLGLALVVRMGRTHRKLIERAQDLLAEQRLPVLGCILNEFAPRRTSDHYYHGYYAYKRYDGREE
jgi:capsular exopolysaccharide synthesis family protein